MLITYDQTKVLRTQFGNVTKRKGVNLPNQEERNSSIQDKTNSINGGRIVSAEGGLRLDVFDHDANSEYDFSEEDCSLCELPEHSQDLIIEDIEYEESNA
tara:strand:+ start:490 stop:789 length:300 start_codon:yes stop_codon:yes gene_type:complete